MRNRAGATQQPSTPNRPSSTSKSPKPLTSTATWIIIVMLSSFISFYVGVWSAWSLTSSGGIQVDTSLCLKAANGEESGELGQKVRNIFQGRLERELKTNCPKSDEKKADKCPQVCFDAPNCNAELGKEMGDIFQSKLDAAMADNTNCPQVKECATFCLDAASGGGDESLRKKIDAILQPKIKKAIDEKQCPQCPACVCPVCEPCKSVDDDDSASGFRFDPSFNQYASGLVSISRKHLFDAYDFGVPMSSNAEKENSLILYQSTDALPSNTTIREAAQHNGDVPHMTDALEATENCDQLNVLFSKPPQERVKQCTVLVLGQYQGYHVQRWMRKVGDNQSGMLDKAAPLHHVSRTTRTDGYDELDMPRKQHISLHQEILSIYLENLKEMQTELKATLEKIAIDNTVVVMTVNKGQSELFMNFVCSAKSKGFDLKNALLVPTDQFSKDLADELGMATFYHEALMKSMPSQEASYYGDGTFGLMMMAKVICVQLVNDLGYDLLFQDVDVVWFKDPINYFQKMNPSLKSFDIYFQDDGSRQERFAPFSANTGFYFVRSNDRTKLLMRRSLYAGDLIFACAGHQQILIFLLADMNSLGGLKVKVFSRDLDEFPGGYNFHMTKDWMKQWVNKEKNPSIFHMSWTKNKDDKLKFMKQMGMWHASDSCVGKDAKEISADAKDGFFNNCCSKEPLTQCFYKDKPSIIPCNDSPVKDKGGESFWK